MRATLASLSVVLILSSSGCSFTFTETVPDRYQELPYFDCSSNMGLPVADGFFAAANATQAVGALLQSKQEYKDKNDGANRDVVAGVAIGTAAIFVASAIFGLVHANQCADAKAELKAKLMPKSSSTHHKIETPATMTPVAPAPVMEAPAAAPTAEPAPTEAPAAPPSAAPVAPAPATPAAPTTSAPMTPAPVTPTAPAPAAH